MHGPFLQTHVITTGEPHPHIGCAPNYSMLRCIRTDFLSGEHFSYPKSNPKVINIIQHWKPQTPDALSTSDFLEEQDIMFDLVNMNICTHN